MPTARLWASARKPGTLRGPAHGLQGSLSTQRHTTAGACTVSLRHSQVMRLQKQGDASESARWLVNMPDIEVVQEFFAQDFSMLVDEHRLPEDQLGGSDGDK
ncbi:hypothetical protein BT96DRAFT_990134 [Gymnopus androsaceus JB14]|uniref:Uncharacterized protein n=1 Tax=Gymnopus androsaceus JB14 TaxID=1447944 RepID=A0A6A4HWL6_9AGAR|nr:hypothetical protein BT96DRAFT_990134 [Gymnopus androsaceus JB14]